MPRKRRTAAAACRLLTVLLILATLQAANWVLGGWDGAAARLGLSRTTLISRMQRLGISAGGDLGKMASDRGGWKVQRPRSVRFSGSR